MKKLTAALLFVLSLISQLQAQDIDEWINSKKPLLFEKLYLHIDRELYAPGDTIWMKVYHLNGVTHQVNKNYRNIFVQLIAENGKVVKDLQLLSIHGQAIGEFSTNQLEGGLYTIRAYTRYLEGFGEETFFHKNIWITNSLINVQKDEKDQPAIDISFLPEGGQLVTNAKNTVAFKAIDSKGKGIYVTGRIMDELGDTITSFTSIYKGMGKFTLMPEEEASYYATLDQYPGLKFSLPKASIQGLSITHKMEKDTMLFEVSRNWFMEQYPAFYLIASHKGNVLFHKKVEMEENSQAIAVDKKLFPAGISKITLLDPAFQPLAERLVFVDHGTKDLLHLKLNQQAYKPREEVKMEMEAMLEPGDSITSTLSVAVVNKNYLSTGVNSQNIKSYLLLDSELKGGIESPTDYLSNDEFHTSSEKLDLLMMVNGWRAYIWDEVEKVTTPSLDNWNDAGLTITGRVKKLLRNAPSAATVVSFDYAFRNKNIGKAITDEQGRFAFKHTYLVDNLKVMMNATTKDGKHNVEIILDPLPKRDSILSPALFAHKSFTIDLNPGFNSDNSYRRMKELEFNPEKGTTLLNGVEVVEKRTRAFSRSFGEYPWADRTFTITKDDYHYMNVLDYLEAKVPGIIVDDVEEMVWKGTRTRAMGLMVDAMSSDYKEFRTIRMREIEMIDIVNPGFRKGFRMEFLGVVDLSGIVAVYRNRDYAYVPQFGEEYIKGRLIPSIKGYVGPSAFYSPKYTLENIASPLPDLRATLYWNPEVGFDKGKANIDFFTSDILSDYVVYVEGVTKEGKICFGTTSFSVDKDKMSLGE